MQVLVVLHIALGAAAVLAASVACVWGIYRSRKGSPRPSARSQALWNQLVATSQTLVIGTGLAGLLLLEQRHHAKVDHLHSRVYGPFMVAAIIAAYSFRTADARWNVRVMAVASLFVAGLGVRAFFTG
jgi:hypothetical protein